MKRNLCILLGVFSLFVFGINASAASKCGYSELSQINQEAAGIKVSYEEKERLLEGDNGVSDSELATETELYEKYLVVNIMNLTENLYVKVINSVDNSVKAFSSADAIDGIISFDWNNVEDIANLTIKVYTSAKTNCADEEVVVLYKTLPKYNYYSTTSYCEEHENESICQQYVTKDVDSDEFYKKVNESQKKKVEETNKADANVIKHVTNFVKENKKGFIIGGSIIIVVGVVTTIVVIIKRRRSRLI